jgi:hypothetical protein
MKPLLIIKRDILAFENHSCTLNLKELKNNLKLNDKSISMIFLNCTLLYIT